MFLTKFKLELSVQLENVETQPGGVLQGAISVKVAQEVSITAIRLSVTGTESTTVCAFSYERGEGRAPRRRLRTSSTTFSHVEQLITVFGFSKSSGRRGGATLTPGEYLYPFAVKIPPGAPPSFHCSIPKNRAGEWGTCQLSYNATAVVDVPYGIDATESAAFRVMSVMSMNVVNAARRQPLNFRGSVVIEDTQRDDCLYCLSWLWGSPQPARLECEASVLPTAAVLAVCGGDVQEEESQLFTPPMANLVNEAAAVVAAHAYPPPHTNGKDMRGDGTRSLPDPSFNPQEHRPSDRGTGVVVMASMANPWDAAGPSTNPGVMATLFPESVASLGLHVVVVRILLRFQIPSALRCVMVVLKQLQSISADPTNHSAVTATIPIAQPFLFTTVSPTTSGVLSFDATFALAHDLLRREHSHLKSASHTGVPCILPTIRTPSLHSSILLEVSFPHTPDLQRSSITKCEVLQLAEMGVAANRVPNVTMYGTQIVVPEEELGASSL